MNKTFRSFLGLSLLLAFRAAGFAAGPSPERNPSIIVRVYSYALVPPASLVRAEEVASEIFRQAGVRIIWLDCSVAVPADQRQPACAESLGPTDFVLNLVEKIQLLSPKLQDSTLGSALVPDGGGQGYVAYISNHRAQTTAKGCAATLGTILGLAAAHEIGHLLLRSNDHSTSGLMRAHWNGKDLERSAMGDLRFTLGQAELVKAGVLARIGQRGAGQPAVAAAR